QSYSGTWLSVEAKTTGAQGNAAVPPGTTGCPTSGSARCGQYGGSQTGACWGNPAGGAAALTTGAGPILNVAYSTDGGATWHNGAQTQMSAYVDDGVYLYHRLLVRLSTFAGNGTAPQLPIIVRVSSNDGGLNTRDAKSYTDTPPTAPG